MSPKQWLALLCVYIAYIFFGASIFYHIEYNKELGDRATELQQQIKINELLVKYASPGDQKIQNKVLTSLSNYCDRPVTNYTLQKYPDDFRWTFYHSFWFAFTVCSTIGYGNSSPHDQPGQVFLILYALIGLPLNGFVLAYLGDFFSKTFVGIYNRYKGYNYTTTREYAAYKKLGMISRIMMFLIPGITFFIFLPACLFSYFEDWPYIRSVYYSFVTLTTIGFGDYVPTFQNGQGRIFGTSFAFYQIFIIFWNVIGVGYFIMIIGFIAKGMQSKRIARLEHQLSMNINATQNRIWTGVTKDLSFLRRILNEVNLLKFEPVYNDSIEKRIVNAIPRSLSCPELILHRTESPRIPRKRTYSENYTHPLDSSTMTLKRVQSDGDLSRIDRKKTFEGSGTLFQTKDLLSSVLTALGSIQPTNEDVQSFSELGIYDTEIWANERKWSSSQSDGSPKNPPRRQRAFSEFCIPQQGSPKSSYEWTWNGNNAHQIKKYMMNNTKKNSIASIVPPKSKLTNSSQTLNLSDTLKVQSKLHSSSFLSRINPFNARVLSQETKRGSVSSQDSNLQKYMQKTSKGRESRISLFQSDAKSMELLENTTIADLIRAVEEVQVKSNDSPESPLLGGYRKDVNSLQLLTSSRRGSLRPVPAYTTIFTSDDIKSQHKHKGASSLSRESTTSSKQYLLNPPYTPKMLNRKTQNLSPSQMLQRSLSLRPSPLAKNTSSENSDLYARATSEAPIITVQPPNVTTSNLLWTPEKTK